MLSREPVRFDQTTGALFWEAEAFHDARRPLLVATDLAALFLPQPAQTALAAPATASGLPGYRRLEPQHLALPGDSQLFLRSDGHWGVPPGTGGVTTDLDVVSREADRFTLASSSGTGTVIPAATAALAGLMSAAAMAKLEGIEAGATANQSDASLLLRSNHSGTQPLTTVSGLAPSAAIDATNAANITSGVLPVERLPVFAGAGRGAVPANGGSDGFLRTDGVWRSSLAGLSGVAPVSVTAASSGSSAVVALEPATDTMAGGLRQATGAEVAALYDPLALGGDPLAAVTLAAAQGQLLPFNLSRLPLLSPSGSDGVPVGRGTSTARGQVDGLAVCRQNGSGAVWFGAITRIKEYCSLNDYLDLQFANDNQNRILIPPGDFVISKEIRWTRSATSLVGAGVGVTRLICADGMAAGHGIALFNAFDCSFSGFSLNGNRFRRGLGPSSRFTGIYVSGGRNRFSDLEVHDAPEFGVLIDGVMHYKAFSTEIRHCFIRDNGGAGLTINAGVLSRVTGNNFRNNGYENFTLDLGSHGSIATGNHFFIHRGGCGNVGWDESRASIFSYNFIDSESTSIPPLDDANGLCINSMTGIASGASIQGNVIVNNRRHGLILRNRTGQPPPPDAPWWWRPTKPGDAMIANNYIRNSGVADIRIEDTNERVLLGHNNYISLEVEDLDADNVRLPAGDVFAELLMDSEQFFPVNNWTQVNFNQLVANRHCDHDGQGRVSLPAGGLYAVNAKIRIDFRSQADGVRWIQLKVAGPNFERISNIEFLLNPDIFDYELSIDFHHVMPKGSIALFVYPSGDSGFVISNPLPATWLSIANLG